MPELYRSAYQYIEYFPEYAMIKRVLMSHPENLGRPGFQHEWLEYANTIRSYQPQHILVDASQFDYIIPKDIQDWINENVIAVFNEVKLKKWAIIIPPQFLNQVSIEQTIEANPRNSFEVQYFETEEDALHWLHNNKWQPAP